MQTRSISPMQTFRRFAPNILFSRMKSPFCFARRGGRTGGMWLVVRMWSLQK